MEDNRVTHTIHEDGKIGEVQIADDVVAIIAGLAATKIHGETPMAGNITNELVSILGMKNLAKGVKAVLDDDEVNVELALNIKFGYNIKDVSTKVQERVKTSIENMTGLTVNTVNIRIANIIVEQNV